MTLASNTLNNKVKEERDIYATSWLDRSRDIFPNQHFQCYFWRELNSLSTCLTFFCLD